MDDETRLRIEVTAEMVLRLLNAGYVCAADFNCLDCDSKRCLWRLCLGSCVCQDAESKKSEPGREKLCRAILDA